MTGCLALGDMPWLAMGVTMSDCRERCDEECDRERRCYVDQGEVKIGTFDVTNYPHGTKVNGGIGRQHSLVADLAAAAMPSGSSRNLKQSTRSASSGCSKARLKPQSVTWAEGFIRQTGHLLGRFQLTPKAASFGNGAASDRTGGLTFEQQMAMVHARHTQMRPQ